ncbi:MAG: hypothetical protein AAFP13_10475 [Pseudomonadota bacterium]
MGLSYRAVEILLLTGGLLAVLRAGTGVLAARRVVATFERGWPTDPAQTVLPYWQIHLVTALAGLVSIGLGLIMWRLRGARVVTQGGM